MKSVLQLNKQLYVNEGDLVWENLLVFVIYLIFLMVEIRIFIMKKYWKLALLLPCICLIVDIIMVFYDPVLAMVVISPLVIILFILYVYEKNKEKVTSE